jgi:hypothetical protein
MKSLKSDLTHNRFIELKVNQFVFDTIETLNLNGKLKGDWGNIKVRDAFFI